MSIDAKLLLFENIKNGNIKDAYMLLEHRLVSLNSTNLAGYTPIHYSVLCDRESIAHMILQFKPDINIKNNYECGHCSPLMTAVKNRNKFLVNILLEHGSNVNLSDKQGLTALHHAAISGNQDIIRLLVDHCADINQRDSFGFNAYYYASQGNYLENNKELATLLGKELKVTTKDTQEYRADFKLVHTIVDRRKKLRAVAKKK